MQYRNILSRLRKSRDVKYSADYRGVPTHACPCGEKTFQVLAIFDDFEIALYTTDAKCHSCGALVTVPTPLDRD